MTAAQAIVECMKRESVNKVFCVPGESYLPLLDALHDENSIDVISGRQEGGVAFAAEGYAKASNKPGIVLATRAVGASNLAIGVHTAYQDSTPMIVFLGQVSRKFRGREGFQEVDLDRYFQPIAKWAVEIDDPERTPEIVEKAFRIAQTGRPGPVVISLPEDVLPMEVEVSFGPKVLKPKPAPSQGEVDSIRELLSQSEKPVIIAGGGIKSAQAEEALLRFAETYQLPVITAFRRQDVFPNHHPLYVGHLGLGTSKAILETVREADTILALGTRLSEVTTQDYSIITKEKKLIHLDISFETIGKVFAPDIGVVADAKEALTALLDINVPTPWEKWVKERRVQFEAVSDLTVSKSDVINKHAIAIMEEKLPEDTIITNDAGNFAGWLHKYFPFRRKNTYIGPTSGAMGYGMPAAIGAKLAYPNKKVVALAGDGGFMMTVQELETAVRYHIPVICIVFNNNMYGTIRMHQEIHYPEKVIGTDLGEVSFKKLAESMGAIGFTVDTPADFEIVLEKALLEDKVTVIEVLTEKEQIAVGSTIAQLRSMGTVLLLPF
ncbi:thiamine pyrophosphate-binding protein [Oceanobacillus saliphilus]|uniref:thiamine pyrophosphate-binding protein n=1 Tax=Oceanobacillus saliphilus TaxID=2925834 RepID=UPI003F683831